MYTIGHLRTRGSKKIFPLQGTNGEDSVQEIDQIGMLDSHRINPNRYRVYGTDGVAPTLDKMDGGREPHIPVKYEGGGTQVAHTLMARDYKGFGGQEMTGVLELIKTPKENVEQLQTPLQRERIGVSVTINKQEQQ